MTAKEKLEAAERILARVAASGQRPKLPTPEDLGLLATWNELLLYDGKIVAAGGWRPEMGTPCPVPEAMYFREAGELGWSVIPLELASGGRRWRTAERTQAQLKSRQPGTLEPEPAPLALTEDQ
jgi:hypothetical protein